MLLGMKSKTKRIAITMVLALAVVGYVLLLWRGPWWIDGAHLRSKDLQPADGVVITGLRTMLVALGVGAVAAITLYYTHRNHVLSLRQYEQVQEQFEHTRARDQEQSELTREGQVTERYVEAIKLLASENLTERLGGIYALERIMRDSEKDHATVVEVLAAFVRQRAVAGDEEGSDEQDAKPDEDVQAALTVLGRRPIHGDGTSYINLRHTDLRGADLSDAKLDQVDLRNARLQRAHFARSFLRDAVFQGAALRKADFSFTHLNGASFYQAGMEETALWQADARNAVFSYANMERARLRDARLQGAAFLHTQLASAEFHNADLAGAMLKDVDLSRSEGLQLEQLSAAVLAEIKDLPSGMSFEELEKVKGSLSSLRRS
ncbi:pentapeptide repeat-containing protein [Streptomyces chartreusis]|uniref:pentapeptide repeat-containing protein n=1 Tax=Streptomyces chartreusis TaxID=1969 RepID=UPI003714CCAC